jgi:mRNA-degrading endonuclease RelE of RelBE toxin-antitoxin system
MSYKVISIPSFDKEIKKLAKKYRSLRAEFIELVLSLEKNPQQGTQLAHNCYKIRLAIASKGKGKSGGARVITCFAVMDKKVFLLTIYDKSDKDNVSDKELNELLKFIL